MPGSLLEKLHPALALVLLAACAFPACGAASSPGPVSARFDLGICNGRFAICAASTCRRSDQKLNGREAAECECPVLEGLSLANLAAIPSSSCDPPAGQIYSLYSTCEPANVATSLMQCPAGSYAQCWNAVCSYTEGARLARCLCPVQHGPFLTPGGQCDLNNCSAQFLVGAPFRGEPGCRIPPAGGAAGN